MLETKLDKTLLDEVVNDYILYNEETCNNKNESMSPESIEIVMYGKRLLVEDYENIQKVYSKGFDIIKNIELVTKKEKYLVLFEIVMKSLATLGDVDKGIKVIKDDDSKRSDYGLFGQWIDWVGGGDDYEHNEYGGLYAILNNKGERIIKDLEYYLNRNTDNFEY